MAASHPSDVRAAVMAALLSGQGVTETAEKFGLPVDTVKSWRRRFRMGAPDAPDAPVKRSDIAGLVFAYLDETLTTLAAQQRFFRNEDWLAKQPANELAVLHGVSCDKAVRLLEALQTSGLAEHAAAEDDE